jgi:hypothetical protein
MTNRVRIAVMALSAAVLTLGASALRIPAAHAARICSNSYCEGAENCLYTAGRYCQLDWFRDSQGHVVHMCTEGEC